MRINARNCVQILAGITFMVVIGLQTSAAQEPLDVTIATDYTPPPGADLGLNEYRAASGPLTLTCQVEGATGMVTYNWMTSFNTPNNQEVGRVNLRSSDSGTHTCTAMDEDGNTGSAEVEVNVVGIGIIIISSGNAVPDNALVISGTSTSVIRFRLQCRSESTEDDVGDFIGLDGNSINNIGSDPFEVRRFDSAGVDVRNVQGMEDVLTASEQGVYTCRLPDRNGINDLEVNIGIYPNGFNTPPTITSLTYDPGTRTLTCTSTGSPATTVTWEKDGVELNIDGSTYQMTQRVTNRRQSTYENVLSVINTDFTGDYMCTVANTLGMASQSVTVVSALCPDPPDIMNGMCTVNGNSVGDTATCTCDSGFELVGTATLTCTQVDANSVFSPAPPVCRPLMCPDPPDIENGMVTSTGNSIGDTATYTCSSGFNLIRSDTATCVQLNVNSAVFSPTPPECRAPLSVTIDIDYTPPPGADLGPNEYRAASTLTLTCLGPTGTETYSWQTSFTSPENQVIGRVNLRSSDSRTHTCTAMDGDGNTGSAEVEVNVVGIGIYIITSGNAVPDNSLVISGTSTSVIRFRLQCRSESTEDDVGDFIGLDGSSINNIPNDPFDVRQFDSAGVDVRNRDSDPVLIAGHQGVYTCRLPDSSGANDLEVNIGIYPNGFDAPPNIISLTLNPDTMTLTCTSTGSPATTVTWRRNGVNLNIDGSTYQMTQRVTDRRQSTYENVLTINADISTVNSFTCSVANVLGSQSLQVFTESVAITTSGPPTIGQSYSLTCTVSGVDNPTVDYEWRDADNNVVSSEQTLLFSALQLSDAGQYTCQATITSPLSRTLTETEDLVILIPRPTVGITRDNRNTLYAGSRLTLTCDIVLNQVLTSMVDNITVSSQWSGPGLSSGRDTVTSVTGSNLAYMSTLTFDTLRTSDSGTYTCQATISPNLNPQYIMEGVNSTEVMISVQNPSLTASLLPSTTRLPNEAPYNSFSLTCTATAPEGVVAEKTFTWRQRLDGGNFADLSNNGDDVEIETTDAAQPASTSVLTVTETTAGEFTYTCEVAFSDGGISSSDMASVGVTVTSPREPLEAGNFTIADLTSSEVTLQWTVPIIAFTPETYVVHYGTNINSIDTRSEGVQSGDSFELENSTFSVELTELEAGTEHYFRVNSINSIGSTLSSVRSFTTRGSSSQESQDSNTASVIGGVLGAILLLTVVISIVIIALLVLRNRHVSAELVLQKNATASGAVKLSDVTKSEEPAYITTGPNRAYEMTHTNQQQSHEYELPDVRATATHTEPSANDKTQEAVYETIPSDAM